VVADGWLKPGTHVNAVGAHSPDARELESTTMAAARVIVDSRDAVRVECGECMIPIAEGLVRRDHFDDELGQLLAGDVPGRRTNDEITVYESCGLAIQDMAVARAIVDRAIDTNEGHDVQF
jgi:alanine dehydrogenase